MRHHSQQQRHEAVDELLNLFTEANHSLTVIHNKLDREFSQVYPQNVCIFLPNHWIWIFFFFFPVRVFLYFIELWVQTILIFMCIKFFWGFSGEPDEACVSGKENSGRGIISEWTVPWASCCKAGTCDFSLVMMLICLEILCVLERFYGGNEIPSGLFFFMVFLSLYFLIDTNCFVFQRYRMLLIIFCLPLYE